MTLALVPDPADAPARAKKSRPHLAQRDTAAAIDTLEAAMGGRQALVDALVCVPPDAGLDYVVGLLSSPDVDARKISNICAAGGISVGELIEAFKRGTLARQTIGAIRAVAAAVTPAVEDIAARSVVHEVDCPVCYGKGATRGADEKGAPIDRLCARCDGSGRIVADPDFARQKYLLSDLAGMGKSGGPAVLVDQRTQTNIIGADGTPAGYARLLHAADRILYGRSAPRVAAEVVEAASVPVPIDSPVEAEYSESRDDG